MPSFGAQVPHSLGKEEAQQRLDSFVHKMQDQFKDQVSDMDGAWEENVLNFNLKTYGIKIEGALTVEDEQVSLKGNLPFAAVAFRGKIESSIKNELEKVLT